VKRHKQLKCVNNFYDSFSASDFKPSETGEKKEKETNINRYLYLYLQTTTKTEKHNNKWHFRLLRIPSRCHSDSTVSGDSTWLAVICFRSAFYGLCFLIIIFACSATLYHELWSVTKADIYGNDVVTLVFSPKKFNPNIIAKVKDMSLIYYFNNVFSHNMAISEVSYLSSHLKI